MRVSCMLQVMFRWLKKEKQHQVVVEKIIHKQAVQARVLSATIKQDLERHQLWKSFCVETAPLRERKGVIQLCGAIVDGIIDGVCSVVDLRNVPVSAEKSTVHGVLSAPVPTITDKLLTSIEDQLLEHSSDTTSMIADAVRAVQKLVNKNIQDHIHRTSLKRHQRISLTWLERSALIWLFLCPQIYPECSGRKRLERIATAGGIHWSVLKKWLAKSGKKSDEFVHKWFHIVRNMTWKDVKVFFPRRWIAKRGVINEQLGVKEQLQPWKEVVASPDTQVSLNKFMFDSPSGAKRAG